VDRQDPSRPGSNEFLDLAGINIVSGWIDVAENRCDLLPLQGMGGRNEGKRRHNNLAAQGKRTNRYLQSDGSITRRNAMLHPDHACDAFLELLNERTAIRQPTCVKHRVDPFEQPRPIPDVRPADMNVVSKGGSPSEKSKFSPRASLAI
jgi:hypothetical protein